MGNVAHVKGNGGISRGTLRTRLRTRLLAALLTLAVALVAFVVLPGSAWAATFTVDDLGDTHDASAGNGSCADAAGKCTLRAAIDEANALGGDDEIRFAGGLGGTITLANGELPIQSNLTITGPGADALTVSGNNADLKAFSIGGASTVSISGLTIADAKRGGIFHYGGTLTLEGSVIRNNGSGNVFGGGVYSSSHEELIIQNTVVSDNTAEGGIYVWHPSLTVRDSTVRNNQATAREGEGAGGGGIYLQEDPAFTGNFSSADVATVEDSLITGNTAVRNGGGIFDQGYILTIVGSTLNANRTLDFDNHNDGGGGTSAPATAGITLRDTTAPETTIDSGPNSTINTHTTSFSFSSSEAGTFECGFDGAAFAACSSPEDYADLADGEHTFRVRATDQENNTDPTPASRTFTVDTKAPEITLDRPAGGSATNDPTPDFSGKAGTDGGDADEVRVEIYAGSETTSTPVDTLNLSRSAEGSFSGVPSTDLPDGAYTAVAVQEDAAGNEGRSTPVTFTVDTRAPVATITGSSGAEDATPTFELSSDEIPATFECRIDSMSEAAFKPCTSPFTTSRLQDGEHTLVVRATGWATPGYPSRTPSP